MTCYFVLLTFNIWLHYNKLLTYLFTYLLTLGSMQLRQTLTLWTLASRLPGERPLLETIGDILQTQQRSSTLWKKKKRRIHPPHLSSNFSYFMTSFCRLSVSGVRQRLITHSTEVWPSDSVSQPIPLKCDQVTASHNPLHWSVTKWQHLITHSTEAWPSDSIS